MKNGLNIYILIVWVIFAITNLHQLPFDTIIELNQEYPDFELNEWVAFWTHVSWFIALVISIISGS